MPSPFLGMDPYLEANEIWPGFHQHLAVELVAQLNPRLGPRYYADIYVRTVIEEIKLSTGRHIFPDAAVLERRSAPISAMPEQTGVLAATLEAPVRRVVDVSNQTKLRAVHIRRTEDDELVTSIEILSPYNKRHGEGIEEYPQKRLRLLRSPVHLIEIDLLRFGERPGLELEDPPLDTDYVLLVNRSHESDLRTSEIWPVALTERLPLLPVPLLAPDPDITLDLRTAIDVIYERAAYARRIDYSRPVPPPELRPIMTAWLKEHLPIAGLSK